MVKPMASGSHVIEAVIGITVLLAIVVGLFPTISTSFLSLSTLGNFSFGSMFATGGLAFILLSVGILLGVLAMLGIKLRAGGR